MAETEPDLARAAFRGLGPFLATLALLIFVPAWDLTYWQGLLYWLVFAGSCLAITLDLMKRDPGLLARRLPAGASAESSPPSFPMAVTHTVRDVGSANASVLAATTTAHVQTPTRTPRRGDLH